MKPLRLLSVLAMLALAIVASVATTSAAQGLKWWQSDHFKKELGLTAEQTRRMEEIFQKALPTLKVLVTALNDAEAKFEQIVDRGDENAIVEQVNVVEAARAELNKTRTLMLVHMRKVMTKDQWAKFTALHQATMPPPPTPERAK